MSKPGPKEAQRRALGAKLAEGGSSAAPLRDRAPARSYAPLGQCSFCDGRREAARAGMRKRRAKPEGGA